MTTETKRPTVTFTVEVRDEYRRNPHWGIWNALRDTLLTNPATHYLSSDAQRSILDSIVKTLGLDPWDEYEDDGQPVLVDSLTAARHAAQKLLDFIPEGGYPDSLAAEGFSHDNVGFFSTEDEYRAYLDGHDHEGKRVHDAAPFFSDPVLYAVLASGKHDGRTLKSYIRELRNSLGITDDDS